MWIFGDLFESREDELIRTIKDSFDITARGGSIYLTCQGVAYKELPGEMSSDEILKELNNARNAALKFIGKNEKV
jgi:hypothetical protein